MANRQSARFERVGQCGERIGGTTLIVTHRVGSQRG